MTSKTPQFSGISSSNRQTENWPWVEKYRPSNLSDLIAHDQIVTTLNRLIDSQNLPHLLFYGPPGTGKTSMIMAAAKRLFGNNYSSMVLELNASDDRGINVVRNQIKEFAGTKKLFSSGVKLVILDEADSMTNDAQFSLRRVIEKYTKNTRFCMICNYVSKIIPALQSRCTRFRFSPLTTDQVSQRITHIAKLENLEMSDAGFKAILRLGRGDMRKILNILQATALANEKKITEENVYLCTGSPLPSHISSITEWLLNENDMQTNYNYLNAMTYELGYALNDLTTEIYESLLLSVDFPPKVKIFLLDEMAQVEKRLATGTSDKLQLGAFVGIFQIARKMMEEKNVP